MEVVGEDVYYSEELIEEIRSRSDIVDVISGYVSLKKQGSNYVGLCPFHSEKSPSFSVSPIKQMYYCFGCGEGGNVFTFIMKNENFTFPEAVQLLAERAGIALPQEELSEEDKKKASLKKELLEVHKEAAKFYYIQLRNESGKQAMEYFNRRELSEDTMKKFGLGFSGKYGDGLVNYLKQKNYSDYVLKESGLIQMDEKRGAYDKFWNRVIFPIMDVNNKVIAFGGRVMGDAKPKYLNSPETKIFEKSRNLYGLNFARTTKENYFLVCEGYMDVIALHQAGFTNAVASLGTALTSQHASMIKRYVDQVYLTYDSDGAGIKAALRAISLMRTAGVDTRIVNMEPYKDPDEFIKNLGADEYRKRIETAMNGFMFEIFILSKEYDLKKPEENTAFFRAAAEKVLVFEEELERENYTRAIAQSYGVDYTTFHKMVVSRGKMEGISKDRLQPKPKSGIREKKMNGLEKAQKLLLTWLIEKPKLYSLLKPYLGPEDFTEGIFADVAKMLFEQLEEGNVNPARIISYFEDEEEQKEAASLFNAKVEELHSTKEEEKALHETLLRVKENRIKYLSEHSDGLDAKGWQELINMRKNMEKLKVLHISLD